MPGLIYAQDGGGAVYVNLYVSSRGTVLVGGARLGLSLESEMRWGGTWRLTHTTSIRR